MIEVKILEFIEGLLIGLFGGAVLICIGAYLYFDVLEPRLEALKRNDEGLEARVIP
jgi:hypothetical protein